jgi:hypothetical protein
MMITKVSAVCQSNLDLSQNRAGDHSFTNLKTMTQMATKVKAISVPMDIMSTSAFRSNTAAMIPVLQ